MDAVVLIREMEELASGVKTSQQTSLFVDVSLEHTVIRWGCLRILTWLRAQAISFRARSVELNLASDLDIACQTLIDTADFLRDTFVIESNHLNFSPNLSTEKVKELMILAKESDQGRVFWTDRSLL